MNRRTTLVGAVLIALLAGLYAGCSSPTENEDTRPPGYPATIINEHTFVAQGVTLVAIDDSFYTYSYSGEAPAVAAGDVWVDRVSGGHIRRVNAVVNNGGTLVLQTADAALVDAVIRGSVNDSFLVSFEPIGGGKAPDPHTIESQVNYTAPGVTVAGGELIFSDVSLLSGTVRSKDVAATINTGRLTFEPNLGISYLIEGSHVWSYEATISGEIELSGDLQVSASDSVFHEAAPTLLHSITHTMVSWIGEVPIVQTTTLQVYGGCTLALQSPLSIHYNVGHSGSVKAGMRYSSSGWSQVWESELEAGPGQAQMDGYPVGSVRCYIKPVLTMQVYSQPGWRIGLYPYLGFQGVSDGFVWDWDVRSGYDLALAASLSSLDASLVPMDMVWSGLDSVISAAGGATVGGLIIDSTPPGASVMLDGAGTGLTTPDTLTHIALGDHEVRIYKEGYNEYLDVVNYSGGFSSVHAVLTVPGWPRPVFFNLSPEEGAQFDDNVITISGSVELEDAGGGRTPYDGDLVVLTLNSVDQLIEVVGGTFSNAVSIFSGDNILRYRATGLDGNTGLSIPLTVVGTFVPDDVVITLSWDSPTSDIDLHVWNPLGEHCYYGHPQISDGFLDIDDVNGYGPETFTATSAINGTYVVRINAWSMHSDLSSNASVAVWLNGGAPSEYGPHFFDVADQNGNNPAAWWEVTVFTMSAGAKSVTVNPLDPERIARMETDMQNLPPKE